MNIMHFISNTLSYFKLPLSTFHTLSAAEYSHCSQASPSADGLLITKVTQQDPHFSSHTNTVNSVAQKP